MNCSDDEIRTGSPEFFRQTMSTVISRDADVLDRLEDQLRDQKKRIHATMETKKVERYKIISKTGIDPSTSDAPYF